MSGWYTAVLTGVLLARTAQACGGFFCSAQLVEQVGEQIVFAVDGAHVTTVIQVQYQGPAQDFSWVLPVPSPPTVTVGTNTLFTRLRGATDPSTRHVHSDHERVRTGRRD